jgi:hypothetical protein
MIAIDIEGAFIPNLLTQLKNIPGVAQVRCNKPLRQKYIDLVGGDGIYIMCMVPQKNIADRYLAFEACYSHADANDPDKHESIIAEMQSMVEDYLLNDIRPKKTHQEGQSVSDNFNELIEEMKAIPNVLQVRYHNPLKSAYVKKIGADGYIITAYVANKEIEDFFLPFITMAPKAVCFNKDKHASLVAHLRSRIEDYFEKDIAPPNSVSVDEMQILQV